MGCYALIIALEREAEIAVGKLGQFTFPPGYYIYVGSAKRGLAQRINYHLKDEKKLRWHIDYLLEHSEVVEVWYAEEAAECLWARTAMEMPQAQILVPGFGSSDCHCPSHLIYFPFSPSFTIFSRMLEERGYRAKKASPVEFISGR